MTFKKRGRTLPTLTTRSRQGVHDENLEVTRDGTFRFEGAGSYRDQRDHVARYSVDLQVGERHAWQRAPMLRL